MTQRCFCHCPVVAVRVTFGRQNFDLSGMGSPAMLTEHAYGCSREGNCEHRTTEACRVRQSNG
ncbi:hypothetical protein R70006_04778 [Paraburkholderia domus]|uniref:hypothetical protein n=1 Tax=Paraburkholderia domus TaxID=2793075 RepID=UPI0019144A2C|nr:hypothetical protein [Paraburkholderia domus]MBK5051686.1 hypothetical protein [Burkholderia sp. R-70006]CAE6789506.1 hypothetical protein R70006_04778 [Paraburkholderia domus]CAE6793480.1 hypothetical protein R75483_05000 [Paraburkholderia domus]